MANLGSMFDATQVEPSQPFAVIPAGKYRMQIVASEIRATNDGNGQYLWIEHEIIDGDLTGRKLWNNLNLWNANQQAVEIAARTMSAICHAAGKLHVADSEELHFIPMDVTVRVRPAGPDKRGVQRDASNEIRGYEPANGSAPAQAAPAAAAPAPAPASATAPSAANMPWKQRRAS